MSRYNTIIDNDIVNGEGVCVSFFVQGCPHHCPGCFNEETWDFNGGLEYTDQIRWDIIKLIGANGLQRNFSILGGEPLALQNIPMVWEILVTVRHAYPHIKIFLWTGYTFSELMQRERGALRDILKTIDVLIDGPFIQEEADLSLKLRGSRNQHIWIRKDNDWVLEE